MTLEEAIKMAKSLADFNRNLAGQYDASYNANPSEKNRKAANTYAERALALDTVIAAANGDMTAEYTPKKIGKWMQSRYVRSVFACSICRRSCDVTFNGRDRLYAYCPHCGAQMNVEGNR